MRSRQAMVMACVVGAVAAGCTSETSGPAATALPSAPMVTAVVTTTTSAVASTTTTLPVDTSVVTSTVAPTQPVTVAPTVAPAPSIEECVGSWPLEDRVALLVWPSVYSADWNSAIDLVGRLGLGGVVLMKPSNTFAASLQRHLGELDAVARHGVLISTDEEGGNVQRLSALGKIPSQEDMSALTAEARRAILDGHAKAIAEAGVDVVLGPVVDVRPVKGHDPLGNGRLFTGDGAAVASIAGEYVAAWSAAGMLPVLKHFPGHGGASTDTHKGLATTPPLEELRTRDLLPYQNLATSGAAVMVGHLDVPDLTNGAPASLSASAYDLLRNQMGYADALVMTDALGMGAIGGTLEHAAVTALAAGADVVIFTNLGAADSVIAAIVDAVNNGRIPVERIDQSAIRVTRELAKHGSPCGA